MGSLDLRKDACGDVSALGGWLTSTLSFLLSFCYRFGLYVQDTFCRCCVAAAAAAAFGGASDHPAGNGVSSSGGGAIKRCCCQRISATGAGGAAGVGTDVVLHTAM